MPNLLKELENWRKKWQQAAKKGDQVMMGLAERMGKKLKAELEKRFKNE
jgi:hypothetical protein